MNDEPDEFSIYRGEEGANAISRITADLKAAARQLTETEARFLVDAYYAMQEDRIRANNQLRALSGSAEPNSIMQWLGAQRFTLEKQVARALDYYSDSRLAGEWARSITGIGPIIAAGLLAHIDVTQSPTVGHIWRYAGMDPTSLWLGTAKSTVLVDEVLKAYPPREQFNPEVVAEIAKRINTRPEQLRKRMADRNDPTKITITRASLIKAVAKRPWNASLKRLCFLIGESFVKVHRLESDHYGKVYAERKEYETAKNDVGDYADQAVLSLSEKNFGADTDARAWYSGCYPAGSMHKTMLLEPPKRPAFLKTIRVAEGKGVAMLPPARIHRRSCRYAVKLFLSHYHHVLYENHFGTEPPKPYIITHGGHTHFLAPPNWPMPRKKSNR